MRRISTTMFMASAAFVLAFAAQAQDTAAATAKTLELAPTSSDQTLTPVIQGNSKVDLATTKAIRKEIMAASNLSVSAQNTEIITNATKVTLRGSVDTAKDKRIIGEIAERHTAPGNVDNQLEVIVVTE